MKFPRILNCHKNGSPPVKDDNNGLSLSTPKLSDPNEDVIEECIGSFKRWHFVMFIVLALSKIPIGWHQIGIVFLAPPVNFTCSIEDIDRCSPHCPNHTFDRSVFHETIITEWDLVCGREYLASISQSIIMLGVLVGSMVFGYLADRYGRRRPILWAVVVQLVTGVLCAFSPWFELFSVMRFLLATATGGTLVLTFVMIMEVIGKKWRTTTGILYQLFFTIGHMSLALFGYYIRNWRYYQLAISLPSICLVICYWFLPESPRWLLATGKKEKAIKVLEKAARTNRLPTENIKCIVNKHYMRDKSMGEPESSVNILDLFRSPIIRKYSLSLCYNWFGCGICFFGLAQYAAHFEGDIFFNTVLSAVMTIPSSLIVIYTIDAWGRRNSLIIANLFAGIPCLAIGLIGSKIFWLKTLLASVGMCGISASFSIVFIYSGEVYPTAIRNIGVGTGSMCARMGSILAPFVTTLNSVQTWIAPVIFGALPVLGALLCLLLPETYGCQLPDTIEEAEELDKPNKSMER